MGYRKKKRAKISLWWNNLTAREKADYINNKMEVKSKALRELELDWNNSKIVTVGKTKMLVPFSIKLQEYYFFNQK